MIRKAFLGLLCWNLMASALVAGAAEAKSQAIVLATNRNWDMLRPGDKARGQRAMLAEAGRRLGPARFHFAGLDLSGEDLVALAEKDPAEPFLRVVRESLRLPLDLGDFLLFLDDLLLATERGLSPQSVWVSFGRARISGILLHPHDVFWKNRPRLYGQPAGELNIDRPKLMADLPAPAKDGDPPGPHWYSRYLNPQGEPAMLAALEKMRPASSLATRVRSLMEQLRAQGCVVDLHTTVRHRERGYLMWGSYLLSQQKSRSAVRRTVRKLERVNRKWKLLVPIRWRHPDGWRATVEAARQMKDTFGVGYASRRGAMRSRHYDGEAVDLTAMGLPRRLTLKAPDGSEKSFDLSAPSESRDLNLSPHLIRWLERHFQLEKIKSDYPHWNDAVPAQ